MPQIKPDLENFAKIKVVGIGGAGGNAVTRMIQSKIKGVEFIAINTDVQDLHNTLAHFKLHIGKNSTKGLGAGMNPELGRLSAEEDRKNIEELLQGADLIFVTCGLGGGTGTGGAPVIAEIARNLGALVLAVVTRPFEFEGLRRMQIANEGWIKLREKVDALITVPNDRIFNLISHHTPILEAFEKIDTILNQGIKGISDLILRPGLINVDFADVKVILKDAGPALLGVGEAEGKDRAIVAAKAAINSPLLDVSIEGAKGVLFNVSGSPDMSMIEINEAAKIITEKIDKREARVIFGATFDETIKKSRLRVTVIATGFAAKPANPELPFKESVISIKEPSGLSKKEEVAKIREGEIWEIPAFLRKKFNKS